MDKSGSQDLASQCGLTLITEMDPVLHARTVERDKAFSAAGVDPKETYDLLSVPSFKELLADANRIHELVENVKLALSIHRPETVAILHKHEGSSCAKCLEAGELTSILEQRRLPAKIVNIFGNFKPEDDLSYKRQERLVITCMDYRLHHPGSLQRLIARKYEDASTSWITYPGAAYVGRNISSFISFLEDLRGLSRMPSEIMVVSHTDCAKYKGSVGLKVGGPSWEEVEPRVLQRDLLPIGDILQRFFVRPRIRTDIAVVESGKAVQLMSA